MDEAFGIVPSQVEAERLDRRLTSLRTRMRKRWLDLGEVLLEIQESLAYRTLGFKNFQTYLADRLEISPRWAMYLIKLVRKMHDYNIDRNDLIRVDVSKSLEIFRLNDAEMIRELLEQARAAKLTLAEIHEIVQRALGIRPVSSDEVVKKLWAFSLDQWLIVERAIQYVQRGGLVGDTRALELICADFLAGVQHEMTGVAAGVEGSIRLMVLERDDWKCQRCGSAGSLHLHHIRRQSRGGPDVEDDLLTLCWRCHERAHGTG